MKNILVVITTAFVPTGGLTTVMMNYYRMMNKEEVKIDFASTNNPPQVLLDEIHASGSEYYQLSDRKNVGIFFCIEEIMPSYDAIHVHANSAMAVMELQAAIWAGIKIRIIHNHSSRSQHNLLNQLFLSLYRRSFTQAVACSDEAGEWLYGKNGLLHCVML